MKVTILGAYGVFGSRLAELLARDGHELILTGRDPDKLAPLAERLKCRYRALDHRREPEAIFADTPEVIVDAAGPFQSYANDPYWLARLCLEHGTDYLDLSDDADLTQGFERLDDQARRAGRRLLSGASSVPGISSVIAADLSADMDEVLLIDTAIMPGNRAPRGASVIASIVGQLGTRFPAYRGGRWRQQTCWTEACRIELAPDLVRTARWIEVPDVRLFPRFFRARSVIFRAALELNVLNEAMRWVGVIRRRWPFPISSSLAEWFRRIANLFLPLGTDRGGMRVLVVGRQQASVIRREWRLIAEAGDGPYIPAVMVRALLRQWHQVPHGARGCLAEVARPSIESAMSDLSVSFKSLESPSPSFFQTALGDRWHQLPPEVQNLHGVQDLESFSGTAHVTRGTSWIAKLAAWLFGFPQAGEQVPLTITKKRTPTGETWERNFGGRVFRSYLTPARQPYRYRERFGPFNYEQDLPVRDACLHLPVHRGWFLGLPLPRFLLPASESREYAENGEFRFDVALIAPLGGGLIVRYRGQVRPDRDAGVELEDRLTHI